MKEMHKMKKRLVYAEDVMNNIDTWLDAVGDVIIDKPSSYYGELMGCVKDAPTVELEYPKEE